MAVQVLESEPPRKPVLAVCPVVLGLLLEEHS